MTIKNSGAHPKPPAFLDKDEKAEWRKVIASQEDGYFNDGHIPLLLTYVASIMQLKKTWEDLKDGYTSEGSQGQLIQHPSCRIHDTAIKNLNALTKTLGIDPASQQARKDNTAAPVSSGEFDGLV